MCSLELELPPSDSEEESPSKPAQEIEPIVEPDIDELLGDTDDEDDRSYRRTGDSRYSVAPDSSQDEPEPPMDDEPEPQMEAESEPRMEAEQTSSEPEPKQTELEPERSIEKVSEEPIVHEIKETEITVEEFTDKSTKAVSKVGVCCALNMTLEGNHGRFDFLKRETTEGLIFSRGKPRKG